MPSTNNPPRGALHIGLWVAQALLALAFIMAGAMKLTQPLDALLANGMTFVDHVPGGLVRFIGLAEVLGAIGLVAPAATRIAPKLTGIAGAALALVMVLAAITHIGKYGSRHTEALVTNDHALAQAFIDAVDSSCVVINASTRFADGNQLGLGAEIGISTTRLHAYGAMGIEELTTTKVIVLGDGQVRN